MSTNIATRDTKAEAIERVLIQGDISRLSADERVQYYQMLCASVGLNPMTRPFEFITLNGKLTLYAKKDATDQLRAINQISITIVGREVMEDCYIVTARATTPAGRTDESIGAVNIGGLKGEARANAVMKSETKAKRRVTLSISGLGLLDELEVETIPSAKPPVAVTTEEIKLGSPVNRDEAVRKGSANASQNGGSTPAADPAAQVSMPTIFYEEVKADVERQTKKYDPDFVEFTNCIPAREKIAFARAWERAAKEAHPAMSKAEMTKLRGEWLVNNGFVHNNEPTSALIPAAIFEDMKRVACNHIKSLKPNVHGVVVDETDVSF